MRRDWKSQPSCRLAMSRLGGAKLSILVLCTPSLRESLIGRLRFRGFFYSNRRFSFRMLFGRFALVKERSVTDTVATEQCCSPRVFLAGLGLLVMILCIIPVQTAWAQSQTPRRTPAAGYSVGHQFLIHSYEANGRQEPPEARDLSGKCLDYGIYPTATGAAKRSLFLNDCVHSQAFVVEELNSGRHEVILHAGNQIVGIRRTQIIGVRRTPVKRLPYRPVSSTTEFPLELFTPSLILPGAIDVVFALDGDSIILASSRCTATSSLTCKPVPAQMVVQLKRARSDHGTPLVVAPRNLADSEFWDFIATDNSDADPTSGFVRVTDKGSLLAAMAQVQQIAQQNGAAWGSVIKVIDTEKTIDLTENPAEVDFAGVFHNLAVPTGVTIRGDRRGISNGPLILGNYKDPTYFNGDRLVQIEGDYVRITGLRLQGPSGTQATWPTTGGIVIGDPLLSAPHQPIETLIDHNELFDWPNEAVMPFGSDHNGTSCEGRQLVTSVNNARIERNFIHHNAEIQLGYGVSVSDGGGATILGNTFFYNRHAITSDATTGDQYSAWDNLVLSRVPLQCKYSCEAEQDFDVHGTQGPFGDQHDGGWAGDYAEIAWNTFLGSNRINFTLRGQPCGPLNGGEDSFHNNVSQRTRSGAIKVWDIEGDSGPESFEGELSILNNHFSSPDPTTRLAVGDFDGDGRQDMFLATGTSWFYSAGGMSEWRYLSGGKTDHIENLLFGDFDGDGRTDVLGLNGKNLMVSWGGISDWEVLNVLPTGASIADLAIGDFDGDGHSDIFYASGKRWYVSYSGTRPFTLVNTSGFRVTNLRFAHFSICGGNVETDVFGIEDRKWHVSCGAVREWAPLPVSLTGLAR